MENGLAVEPLRDSWVILQLLLAEEHPGRVSRKLQAQERVAAESLPVLAVVPESLLVALVCPFEQADLMVDLGHSQMRIELFLLKSNTFSVLLEGKNFLSHPIVNSPLFVPRDTVSWVLLLDPGEES